MWKATHNCEASAGGVVQITQMFKDDLDQKTKDAILANTFKGPFAKGQAVVFTVKSMSSVKGVKRTEGELEALTEK